MNIVLKLVTLLAIFCSLTTIVSSADQTIDTYEDIDKILKENGEKKESIEKLILEKKIISEEIFFKEKSDFYKFPLNFPRIILSLFFLNSSMNLIFDLGNVKLKL